MMKEIPKSSKIGLGIIVALIGAAIILVALAYVCAIIFKVSIGDSFQSWQLYAAWGVVCIAIFAVVMFDFRVRGSRRVLKVNKDLENSHFMTQSEIAANEGFTVTKLSKLNEVDDGIPVMAEKKKGDINVILKNPIHTLLIGTTGTGKTTAAIEPMIEILCRTRTKPSMIITDPKGELFSLHSKFLKERGYDVKVIDLRDTYSSYRWNPLDSIWDMYREFNDAGRGIIAHQDNMADYPDLKQVDGLAFVIPFGVKTTHYDGHMVKDNDITAETYNHVANLVEETVYV